MSRRHAAAVLALGLGLAGCAAEARPAGPPPPGMVLIPAGSFLMGSGSGDADEQPVHRVAISAFYLDIHEVTTGAFARFVQETGYRTEAERWGWAGVFDPASRRWVRVDGADWRHPEGPGAPPARAEEPVTQVSWADAAAYAGWAGKRLPTEAELEYAARGGQSQREYAWGDEPMPGGRPVANWWQGHFPDHNTVEDGYAGRAPVGRFPPGAFGVYDLTGNVWEWAADWYAPDAYAGHAARDPRGPERGTDRVLRGGAWTCAPNYCARYRVAARSHSAPDAALNNTGFRLARDLAP